MLFGRRFLNGKLSDSSFVGNFAKRRRKILQKNLENFSCPKNPDVENFIRKNSISFAKQYLSSVWIVFAKNENKNSVVGYFALLNKHFQVDLSNLSKTLAKRVQKFATFEESLNRYVVSAPLIGQIGKNFSNDCNKLITGDELLKIACEKVQEGQRILGGRIVYLECEDTPQLVNFYESNGFYNFGRRELKGEGKYLLQFLKYLK